MSGFQRLAQLRPGPVVSANFSSTGPGSIVQIEARHAASIALLTGAKITPDGAFDKPLTQIAVLAAVKPLITGQGPPPGT